jgi:hypothetical protein
VPTQPATSQQPQPIPAVQSITSVLWPSFLTAAVATIVFFTLFDPIELGNQLGLALTRMAGYTGGFFGFWFLTSISCALTCYFRRPCHRLSPAEERNNEQ